MDKEAARQLLKELTAAVDTSERHSVVQLVRRAERLAVLVGDKASADIFHWHLDGVPNVPDSPLADMWRGSAQREAVADRRLPTGKVALPLEVFEREVAAVRARLAKSSPEGPNALCTELRGYETVEAKIRNRVNRFVACVNALPGVSEEQSCQSTPLGMRIFIGHGGSPSWKDLQSFLKDRLHLDCVEFNTESQAGNTTCARLGEMLAAAGFAFLVMTGEDAHADGRLHPRENVIHEASLFQGRLGFNRAIVLLEDECEQFSKVHGLTHIGFPKGNIMAASEEIRRVLEREGILPPSAV
jgi:predicted nucleotide-binding protein